jgi:hypothetical protein
MSKFDWFSQPLFSNKGLVKMAQNPINEDRHLNETCDLFINENKISIEERSEN